MNFPEIQITISFVQILTKCGDPAFFAASRVKAATHMIYHDHENETGFTFIGAFV